MPSAKCHRCAVKLYRMATSTLSALFPVLLLLEGKSQSGMGKVCGSCMRRVNEHWQTLREKPDEPCDSSNDARFEHSSVSALKQPAEQGTRQPVRVRILRCSVLHRLK